MAQLGPLLEAMHEAPRATSFFGSARQGRDPAGLQQFVERLNRRPGGSRSVLHRMHASSSTSGAEPLSGYAESSISFWYSEGKGRVDRDETRSISVPGKSFRYSRGTGGIVDTDERQQSGPFGQLGLFFKPAVLLGSFKLRIIDTPAHAGRPCWHVADQGNRISTSGRAGMGHGRGGHRALARPGSRHCAAYEGRFEGEVISRFEITELVVGQPIEPAVFAFDSPDGSPVRSQGEMWLERLRARGVDVTGIDPEDPAQVQEAMRTTMGARHTPVDVEQLAAQHVPKGPPPADEAAARRDIEVLGSTWANGARMAPVSSTSSGVKISARARRRSKSGSRNTSTKELGPRRRRSNSSTHRRLSSGLSHPVIGIREGRAVLVDGKWKVSRATWSGLLAGAGVICPPPPGESQ